MTQSTTTLSIEQIDAMAYNEQVAHIAGNKKIEMPNPRSAKAVRQAIIDHYGAVPCTLESMPRSPGHCDLIGGLAEGAEPIPELDGVLLSYISMPSVTPGHPRQLSLSLSGPRRRAVHGLLQKLKADQAVIPGRRGVVSTDVLVGTFQDAIYWLIDQLEEPPTESDQD